MKLFFVHFLFGTTFFDQNFPSYQCNFWVSISWNFSRSNKKKILIDFMFWNKKLCFPSRNYSATLPHCLKYVFKLKAYKIGKAFFYFTNTDDVLRNGLLIFWEIKKKTNITISCLADIQTYSFQLFLNS